MRIALLHSYDCHDVLQVAIRRRSRQTPCLGCSRSTFCLDLLVPAHGRAEGGHGPFLRGRGGGWVVFPAAKCSAPVTRPTACIDPPTSPPRRRTGAQLGGWRW